MKRVFIAGPYSSDNVMQVLRNIRQGVNAAIYLISHGFSVYCPFLDYSLVLCDYGDELSKFQLQANSLSFVECCDCMLVLPGWEDSQGTRLEMQRATDLNIMIYFNADALIAGEGVCLCQNESLN